MPELTSLSRALIIAGALLILLGALVWFGGRLPLLGRLPGDFTIKRGSTTIYIPLATSLLLSMLLTLLLRLIFRR